MRFRKKTHTTSDTAVAQFAKEHTFSSFVRVCFSPTLAATRVPRGGACLARLLQCDATQKRDSVPLLYFIFVSQTSRNSERRRRFGSGNKVGFAAAVVIAGSGKRRCPPSSTASAQLISSDAIRNTRADYSRTKRKIKKRGGGGGTPGSELPG